MRNAGLAVEHTAQIPKLAHHLALKDEFLAGALLALESADPANVTHGGFDPFDMELILQTDGQTMKGTNGPAVLGIIVVELLGIGQRSIEEDLVQAVYLVSNISQALCDE